MFVISLAYVKEVLTNGIQRRLEGTPRVYSVLIPKHCGKFPLKRKWTIKVKM
jgi:hypothetical protein